MSHTFVLSWDCHGLESCINVSNIEKENMWDILKEGAENPNRGRNNSVSSIVSLLVLRARFNSQRHYEIYAIDTDDSFTEESIRQMFDESPQASAELIRARGRKLYSDRADENSIKIR